RRQEMSDGYGVDLWRGFDGCNRARNMVVVEHDALGNGNDSHEKGNSVKIGTDFK
ncbi:hypothetical protein A2U01_0087052, partial [Trifolium medium]|nr:hypothetical protein [Trifolium medium]